MPIATCVSCGSRRKVSKTGHLCSPCISRRKSAGGSRVKGTAKREAGRKGGKKATGSLKRKAGRLSACIQHGRPLPPPVQRGEDGAVCVATQLDALVKYELQHSAKGELALELYAGAGRIAASARKLGFGAIAFEIEGGGWFDLMNTEVRNYIYSLIDKDIVAGVWLGTTCTTWSAALAGEPGTACGRLRSVEFPLGLPGLSPDLLAKAKAGNRDAAFTARVIAACSRSGVPVILENPAGSLGKRHSCGRCLHRGHVAG